MRRLVTSDVAGAAIGGRGDLSSSGDTPKNPTWRRAILAGLVLGLAELTKFSLLLLYGLWPLLWLAPVR